MSSMFGRHFRISIFGEAASDALGIVIEGIEAGTRLDFQAIRRDLDRYANNLENILEKNNICRMLSGCIGERTTGAPLCILIENPVAHTLAASNKKDVFRPSTSDFGAYSKYGEDRDHRGGGHYSQRMCVALTVGGSVAKQVLYDNHGVALGAHIASIGKIKDHSFETVALYPDYLLGLAKQSFPVLNETARQTMQDEIKRVSAIGDTLGGSIECAFVNMRSGIGDPLFYSAGGVIASAIFAIPQACGIQFGLSELSSVKGSTANDPLYVAGGSIRAETNNSGGISGGITTGMPLIFKAMFAPPPDILTTQKTVDIDQFEDVDLKNSSNFGTCLIPALIPVVEGAAAIAVLDMILG